MDSKEISDIIKDLIHNIQYTTEDTHINYKNDKYSLSIFGDREIWNMEVEEDNEICRGKIATEKFFVLDEIELF
jgi:hypothetical protein